MGSAQRKPAPTWSPRDAVIIQRRLDGISPTKVALDMELSPNVIAGVISRARAAGIQFPPLANARTVKRKPATPPLAIIPPEKKIRCAVAKRPRFIGVDLASGPDYTVKALFETDGRVTVIEQTPNLPPQSLDDVQASGGCRWPHGDPRKPDFHFCGRPREESELPFNADPAPYCADHRRKALSPLQLRRIFEWRDRV